MITVLVVAKSYSLCVVIWICLLKKERLLFKIFPRKRGSIIMEKNQMKLFYLHFIVVAGNVDPHYERNCYSNRKVGALWVMVRIFKVSRIVPNQKLLGTKKLTHVGSLVGQGNVLQLEAAAIRFVSQVKVSGWVYLAVLYSSNPDEKQRVCTLSRFIALL
jgi:hypothetical protein